MPGRIHDGATPLRGAHRLAWLAATAMKLVGMFDSPFVRRVAVSLHRLGLPFEHLDWSVGADFQRICSINPLGRVPALVLDDGSVLVDSSSILDALDQLVGPQRALLPPSGIARRNALQLIALAMGAAESARDAVYEQFFRPPELQHKPWIERRRGQLHAAVAELERMATARGLAADGFFGSAASTGGSPSGDPVPMQVDVTVTCIFTFLRESGSIDIATTPALAALAARCEARDEFSRTYRPWFAARVS